MNSLPSSASVCHPKRLRFSSALFFLFLGLEVLSPIVARATNYYVSATGNDSNSGTSTSAPWKTITQVNSRGYAAGDQIPFNGGSTFSGNLFFTTNTTGIAASPVKVASYGAGKASINGGATTAIYVYNIGGITFDNLILYGAWNGATQSGSTGAGIYFYCDRTGAVKLSGVTVSNCEVRNFEGGGVVFGASPSDSSQSGYNNVLVTTTSVHDNGDSGVATWGIYPTGPTSAYAHTNVTIRSVTSYNNYGIVNKGIHSGNGIILGGVSVGLVEKCVAYNNGWYSNFSGGGPVGIWCWDSSAVVFQYNESHHNGTGGGTPDGDGFDLDGAAVNCVMQYNYSHDNWGAGYLIYEYGSTRTNNHGNTIRYNISQNDSIGTASYSGIWLYGNCTGNRIYNNTVYTTTRLPVSIGSGSDNWFLNNIFFCNASGAWAAYIATANCTFVNNDYYSGAYPLVMSYNGTQYSTLAAFRAASGMEKIGSVNYGFNVDPKLQNPGNGGNVNTGNPSTMTNYKLLSSSPLINAGYNLTSAPYALSVGTSDFYRTSVFPNGAYDVGAHEYK